MNLPFFIAKRYFFSRSGNTAVNILSGISVLGLMVGTASLLVILAAFNGLEDLVRGFYQNFDPDIRIEAQIGKTFDWPEEKIQTLKEWPEVASVSPVLEERALLRYRGQEFIATLKGVDSTYAHTSRIAETIYRGEYEVRAPDVVLGIGVAWNLGLSFMGRTEVIQAFIPRARTKNLLRPDNAFNQDIFYPAGIFAVQPDFDIRYVFTDIERLRLMSEQPDKVTSIDLHLAKNSNEKQVIKKLQSLLGSEFSILNRDQQQSSFFKVMRAEGLVTYFIFSLILLIASFTLMGSLSMMMIDKKFDLKTLWNMGLHEGSLRKVFLYEGLLITAFGAGLGLVIGLLLIFLQDQFGMVSMGVGYVVDAYPVTLKISNLLLVILTVGLVGTFISLITAYRLRANELIKRTQEPVQV